MKIVLADHFGICFGVRDAVAQAEQLAAAGPLTILGELVHNPIVRERLQAQGVGEAPPDWPSLWNLTGLTGQVSGGNRPAAGRDGDDGLANERSTSAERVMITAHGASDAKRELLRRSGAIVADATCPLVRHAHDQLKRLVAGGFFPVVIGRPGHVEVSGLVGDFPEAVVLSAPHDIGRLPRRPRYGIISQTTQPIEFVRQMVELVRETQPESEVRFVDTVCKPTKDRQSALRKLIAAADLIVVVGGKRSNNTQQLVETCRRAGRRAIHIERAEELSAEDFGGLAVVGLTAGTSTLPETVEAVFARLKEFAEHV